MPTIPPYLAKPTNDGSIPNGVANTSLFNTNAPRTNYVTTSPDAQTTNQTIRHKANSTLNVDFQENVLDSFDLPTYIFKFFMAPPEDYQIGDLLDENQIIIAQSGVSEITIDDVVIESIACPSVVTGTGTGTKVRFVLSEPGGGGNLLDKMYLASLNLGIGNWKTAPYFLELQFRARASDTSEPLNLSNQPIGNMRWVFPLTITEVTVDIKNVGAIYEFSGILYPEKAQSDLYYSLKHNISVDTSITVSDALTQIQKKLNEDEVDNIIAGFEYENKYTIEIDGEMGAYKLTSPKENQESQSGSSTKALLKKAIDFNQGTSIDSIINTLLSNTQEFQISTKNSTQPDSNDGDNKTQAEQTRQFWRIVTDVKPLKFDRGRQDYALDIKIKIIKYLKGNTQANAAQLESPDPTVAEFRLNEYFSKGMLRKRYDYIFTGRNDQVINFNIHLNHAFATSIPNFGGIYSHMGASNPGMVHHDPLYIVADARRALVAYRKVINDAEATESERTKAKEELDRTKLAVINPEERNRIDLIEKNIKNPDRIKQEISNREEGSTGNQVRKVRSATQERITQATQVSNYQNTFKGPTVLDNALENGATTANTGSSIIVRTSETITTQESISPLNRFVNDYTFEQGRLLAKNMQGGKINPIVFAPGMQDNNLQYGVDSSHGSGKNFVGAFFTSVLYQGSGTSLVGLEIEIKGDPYWLPPFAVPMGESASKRFTMPDLYADLDASHNPYKADNFIAVMFRTPRIYEEDTGVADPYTDVETLTGVYSVTFVDSTFSKGKFTQKLRGNIDPVISIEGLRKSIEAFEQAQLEILTNDQLTVKDKDGAIIISPTMCMKNPLQSGSSLTEGATNIVNAAKVGATNAASSVTSTVSSIATSVIGGGSKIITGFGGAVLPPNNQVLSTIGQIYNEKQNLFGTALNSPLLGQVSQLAHPVTAGLNKIESSMLDIDVSILNASAAQTSPNLANVAAADEFARNAPPSLFRDRT